MYDFRYDRASSNYARIERREVGSRDSVVRRIFNEEGEKRVYAANQESDDEEVDEDEDEDASPHDGGERRRGGGGKGDEKVGPRPFNLVIDAMCECSRVSFFLSSFLSSGLNVGMEEEEERGNVCSCLLSCCLMIDGRTSCSKGEEAVVGRCRRLLRLGDFPGRKGSPEVS